MFRNVSVSFWTEICSVLNTFEQFLNIFRNVLFCAWTRVGFVSERLSETFLKRFRNVSEIFLNSFGNLVNVSKLNESVLKRFWTCFDVSLDKNHRVFWKVFKNVSETFRNTVLNTFVIFFRTIFQKRVQKWFRKKFRTNFKTTLLKTLLKRFRNVSETFQNTIRTLSEGFFKGLKSFSE